MVRCSIWLYWIAMPFTSISFSSQNTVGILDVQPLCLNCLFLTRESLTDLSHSYYYYLTTHAAYMAGITLLKNQKHERAWFLWRKTLRGQVKIIELGGESHTIECVSNKLLYSIYDPTYPWGILTISRSLSFFRCWSPFYFNFCLCHTLFSKPVVSTALFTNIYVTPIIQKE